MFAIVDIGGFQEKVSEGTKLRVPTRTGDKGANLKFEQVLLVADGDDISFGAPFISGAFVEAKVVEHGKGDKIRVVKAHRRKRYRRLKGHRQGFTEIEIGKISLS